MGWRLVLLAGMICGLSGCATLPKSCEGLPPPKYETRVLPDGRRVLMQVRSEPETVPELRCRADQGVQAAQVALGKRYETGDGVARDVARAVELYERAAISVPANTAIYSPPVKLGGSSRMLFVPNPNAGPGSAEAQYRLGRLLVDGAGVPRDVERGRSLIERAAKQGYVPALDNLKPR